eukprot:11691843-Alexandrium_andersonii.AAC.1
MRFSPPRARRRLGPRCEDQGGFLHSPFAPPRGGLPPHGSYPTSPRHLQVGCDPPTPPPLGRRGGAGCGSCAELAAPLRRSQ